MRPLVAQDYPAEHLDVIVIADNCTDDTAAVAAAAGATVWERHDLSARGKGQALGWALARLRAQPRRPEAVLVVDADCIASANLCAVVAEELADPGVQAIQARYDVSNPEESPTAALRAAGFILKHVIRSRGRARLGLSCGLFGSGMAFRTSLFDEVQWPTSVTEDTELHLELIQRGVIVTYAERASVRSAMPTTAEAAVDQQLRWESGNAQLAGSHLLGLVTRGAATGDVQLLAAAAELLAPSQSMLAAGSLGLGAASHPDGPAADRGPGGRHARGTGRLRARGAAGGRRAARPACARWSTLRDSLWRGCASSLGWRPAGERKRGCGRPGTIDLADTPNRRASCWAETRMSYSRRTRSLPAAPHRARRTGSAARPREGIGEEIDAAGGDHSAVDSVVDELRDPGDPRRHHRQPVRHRLHEHDGESLGEARQAEDIRGPVQRRHVALAEGAAKRD